MPFLPRGLAVTLPEWRRCSPGRVSSEQWLRWRRASEQAGLVEGYADQRHLNLWPGLKYMTCRQQQLMMDHTACVINEDSAAFSQSQIRLQGVDNKNSKIRRMSLGETAAGGLRQ
jgi:hypothetical protein